MTTPKHYADGNPFKHNVRLLTAIAQRAHLNRLLGRTRKHVDPVAPALTMTRCIEGVPVRVVIRCDWAARGFCAAAVDDYCIGGYRKTWCHG